MPAITAKPEASFEVAVEPNPIAADQLLLTGVPISTDSATYTAADLAAAVDVPAGCSLTVETAAGEPLTAAAPLGTGCVAVVRNDHASARYILLVKGDVLGTGELNIAQIYRMAADLTDRDPLTGIYSLAGKVTSSPGPVNIADLVGVARMLIEADD